MKLSEPFKIGSRLLPALKIGDGWLSLEYVGNDGGRMVFKWYADIPAGEFEGADLKSGIQGAGYQEMFGTYLCFLGAAAEGYDYDLRNGPGASENSNLFPPQVVEWAYQHSDEISMIQMDIEDESARGQLITGDGCVR